MKQKHLTIEQRRIIEKELNNGNSFKGIARIIGKDPSTISKEIRLNSTTKKLGSYGRVFNNCRNRFTCDRYYVCDSFCHRKNPKLCRLCGKCLNHCIDFIEVVCPSLAKPPYVCNGCDLRSKCTLTKCVYDAITANQSYRFRKSDSREGFVLSQQEIDFLNQLLYPLIVNQGQSIHHVYATHKDEIMVSEKTLYNLIDAGALSIRNIDLPRRVKYKARRKKKENMKVDKKCLEGRRYEDFEAFIKSHPTTPVVQMDSVEGVKGGKCLLTLHFTNCSFMLAFLRERNDAKSVIDFFNHLYDVLGVTKFKELFPLILTDNGSEFSNPSAIEFDSNGHRRTRIFYCHSSSPQEKGACENNHALLRRILPKGKDMSHLNQSHIDLMLSHVNSYLRANLNNKSPLLLFSTLYGEEIAQTFHISAISPDDVCLLPKLLPSK